MSNPYQPPQSAPRQQKNRVPAGTVFGLALNLLYLSFLAAVILGCVAILCLPAWTYFLNAS